MQEIKKTNRKGKIEKARNKKVFAISQIASLMLEIIAFAFLFSLGLGLSVGDVNSLQSVLISSESYKPEVIEEDGPSEPPAPSLAVNGARAPTGTESSTQMYNFDVNGKPYQDDMGMYSYDSQTGLYSDETGSWKPNSDGIVSDFIGGGGTSISTPSTQGNWFSRFFASTPPANWGKTREFDTLFGKVTLAPMWGNLLQGVQWAGVVLTLTSTLAGLMSNENTQSLVKSLGLAVSAGILTFKTSMGAFETFASKPQSWGARYGKSVSIGAGILVAYYIFADNYEKTETKQQTIQFQCLAWQAPRGGADCDKCNGNPLKPCSEYRCRSLGQTCKLINPGTGKEKCIDGSIDDVTSPGIKPDPAVLTPGYSYTDVKIRPPGGAGTAGMTIVNEEGSCLKAFTPFTFGIITTDNGKNGVETQPAQCKIDFNHTTKLSEMQYYMGGDNLYTEYHNESLSMPGTELLNSQFPAIKNDGEYTMYIRCKDGNGNENRDEFAVRFCIDKTPDLTAPIIKTTSIPSNSPVLYQVDNLSLNVYTNEPASCKWSRKDADYSNMENDMNCNRAVWEMNAEMLYTCNTQLTGIKDKEANQFYFRCTDLMNNTMQQSYSYNLIGTQPLNILKVGPNETIGGSTSTITTTLTIQTDNGFRNGEAICSYSPTNGSGYIDFYETGGNTHKQPLDLTGGTYTYYFKCVDAGGNTDFSSTSFNIFVDKYSPAVARAYSLENKLVIITDEISSCSYSTSSCNFDLSKNEGLIMPYADSINHYAEWKTTQNYYVKCSDGYGNSPNPTECSIIIRPYELRSN